MTIWNGKQQILQARNLLRLQHFPHYINHDTKPEVLKIYRGLIRQSRAFFDPLCREYLLALTYQSFMAFKYVAQKPSIDDLITQAKSKLHLLADANSSRRTRSIYTIMNYVCASLDIVELPMFTLHKTPFVDHSSLEFQIKHLHVPSKVNTFEEHYLNQRTSTTLFYKFLRMIQNNSMKFGFNDRSVNMKLPKRGTIDGKPFPLARQKNIVRRYYEDVLANSIRPVNPLVIKYLKERLENPGDIGSSISVRFRRRRLLECLNNCYTVEKMENGEIKRINHTTNKLADDIYSEFSSKSNIL